MREDHKKELESLEVEIYDPCDQCGYELQPHNEYCPRCRKGQTEDLMYKAPDGIIYKVSAKKGNGYSIYRRVFDSEGVSSNISEIFIVTEKEFNYYTKDWELIEDEYPNTKFMDKLEGVE